MSARMEKVREALGWLDGDDGWAVPAAALAEVEEWEATTDALVEAAVLAEARAEAAEAEADRLKRHLLALGEQV